MEMGSSGLLLVMLLHVSMGFSVLNSKRLFPTSIGGSGSRMTSTNEANVEVNIHLSNQKGSKADTASSMEVNKNVLMKQTVVKQSNYQKSTKSPPVRTRLLPAIITDLGVDETADIIKQIQQQNVDKMSEEDASLNNIHISKEHDVDNVDDAIETNKMFPEHVRTKRSTNDTAAASSFLDDPNNVAMFIVLPAIVFVYGGCICIYCVHKCQDYVERVEPLKVIKQKVFGLPPETPEPHSREWMKRFMKRRRPTSSRSLPDPESTQTKEFDTRSIFSDTGISYFRDTTNKSAFSETDIDSGVHSEGSRANDNVIYVDADSPDIQNLNDMTVEVRRVETSEIAVQTEDIHITTTSSSDMCVFTCETGTSMHEKTQPKKIKKKSNNVSSRYLSWLRSARELREVLDNNTEPRTLHQMLKIAAGKENTERQDGTESDPEVNQQNTKQPERKVEKKPEPKRQTSSPIISVEPYQNDSSYISIHKKKANLLKQHGSFKGSSNAVTPLETRHTSASTSSSRVTDSPPGDGPPPYYRLGDVKGPSYMSMYKKKPIVAKEGGGGRGSGDATKYVGINSSDTDSLV
ncbi:uncharacterized protein LOC110454729 [Mizuhopecten yessoensis]|uniref:uncharacterized protein LOC110454729 n=1 Tax=Mizuhopecten yessoensis TaxID=6573 RepID=UPI000B459959|nr:uncharacterized protein LOC110454729 [Mizuhopecten yessoensis]